MNTNLFNDVSITLNGDSVIIILNERWYWWPNILVHTEDPDINIWVRHPALNKLTYGLSIENKNFRGRKETLRLGLKTGFNESAFLMFSTPFLDKQKKWGLQIECSFSRNREMFIDCIDNNLIYFNNAGHTLESGFQTGLMMLYRPAYRFLIKIRTSFDLSKTADTVLNRNSLYQDKAILKTGTLNITCQIDQRNFKSYPLQGYFLQGEVNISSGISGNYKKIYSAGIFKKLFRINKIFYTAHSFEGRIDLDKQNWFYDFRNTYDYMRNVRGYELYYFPCNSYWLSRQQLKILLINNKIIKLPLLKMSQFNPMPIYTSVNLFCDFGKCFDVYKTANNPASDKFQASTGIGIDFSTYYNKTLRIEYTINKEGKKGLYLQFINLF